MTVFSPDFGGDSRLEEALRQTAGAIVDRLSQTPLGRFAVEMGTSSQKLGETGQARMAAERERLREIESQVTNYASTIAIGASITEFPSEQSVADHPARQSVDMQPPIAS